MTSNRFFSNSKRIDFKRDITWTIMYGILFFLAMPVAFLIGAMNIRDNFHPQDMVLTAELTAQLYGRLRTYMAGNLGMGAPTVFLAVFAHLEAYHAFGFLHRSVECNAVHALPQTRRQIYFARFANGLSSVLLPYTAALLLGAGAARIAGLSLGDIVPALLTGYGLNLVLFVMTYALAVNAVMLTGKALSGILGMAVFYGYFPLFSLIIEELPGMFFATYSGIYGPPSVAKVLGELSPLTQTVYYGSAYMDHFSGSRAGTLTGGMFLLRVVIGIAVCVLLILSALCLYKKRPLEKAGDAMVFPRSEAPIRILLEIIAVFMGMAFLHTLRPSLLWDLFGACMAVLLTHFIVELIYRADAKRIFRHKAELLIVLAAAVFTVFAFSRDLFGYDRYLPSQGDLLKVKITEQGGGEDGRTIFMRAVWEDEAKESSGDDTRDWYYYSEYETAEAQYYTAPEELAAALVIAQAGVENTIEQKQSREPDGIGAAVSDVQTKYAAGDTAQLRFEYVKKSGRSVYRTYWVPVSFLYKNYGALYESESRIMNLYPALSVPEEKRERISVELYADHAIPVPEALEGELLDAVRMDMRDMTMESIGDSCPLIVLRVFITEDMALAHSGRTERPETGWGETEYYLLCPVFPSFANTLSVIREAGIDIDAENPLRNTDKVYYVYYDEEGSREGIVEDPELIGIMADHLFVPDYSGFNMFCSNPSDLQVMTGISGGSTYLLSDAEETRALIKTLTGDGTN